MGNTGSTGLHDRRRNSGGQPPQPEIAASRYVFAAAQPRANSPPYYQYPGYYPHPAAMPFPMPAPYNFHQLPPQSAPTMMLPPAYVEHQKAVTVRNDVNVKKETLRIEPDDENPGKFLVAFSFDAAMPGRLTLVFFATETDGCHLTSLKESSYPSITFQFEQGLGQKFKQPSGTGIDLLTLQEGELPIDSEASVYPLAVKAEASPDNETGNGTTNSQITLAVFQKDKGEYQVKVVKQILWVNGMRYELQEIYGIGNTVEDELDGNDPGKDCVICLSEPRDTTVLPCRHMCMCSECAKVLRFQTNRCPICRQPVERLLEIKVHNGTD